MNSCNLLARVGGAAARAQAVGVNGIHGDVRAIGRIDQIVEPRAQHRRDGQPLGEEDDRLAAGSLRERSDHPYQRQRRVVALMVAIERVEAVDHRTFHLEQSEFRLRQPHPRAVGRHGAAAGRRRSHSELLALQLAAALHDFVSPLGLLIGSRAAGRHDLADGPPDRRSVGGVALHHANPGIGGEHADAHV